LETFDVTSRIRIDFRRSRKNRPLAAIRQRIKVAAGGFRNAFADEVLYRIEDSHPA